MSKTKSTKTAKAAKKAPAKKTKEPKDKKLSAIDAAAQVLATSKEPLNAKELIEAMAAKGLWTSPGGKTPHATLYSALIREIATKGKEARFVKTERGKFAAKA
jgi:HB1, ASXL, restriction endonuclease HTH domain